MPQATPAAAMSVLVLSNPLWPEMNRVARRARFRPDRPSVPRSTIPSTSAGLFSTAFVLRLHQYGRVPCVFHR